MPESCHHVIELLIGRVVRDVDDRDGHEERNGEKGRSGGRHLVAVALGAIGSVAAGVWVRDMVRSLVGCRCLDLQRRRGDRSGTTGQPPVLESGLTLSPARLTAATMATCSSRGRVLAKVVTWPLMPALTLAPFASDVARTDGTGSSAGLADALVIAAMLAVLAGGRGGDRPRAGPAAGWAFLGLGTAVAWSAFCDDYADTRSRRRT